jgi:hypothetical protein
MRFFLAAIALTLISSVAYGQEVDLGVSDAEDVVDFCARVWKLEAEGMQFPGSSGYDKTTITIDTAVVKVCTDRASEGVLMIGKKVQKFNFRDLPTFKVAGYKMVLVMTSTGGWTVEQHVAKKAAPARTSVAESSIKPAPQKLTLDLSDSFAL